MNIRSFTRLAATAALAVALSACADDAPGAQLVLGESAASATTDVLAPGSVVDFHATEFSFTPMELTAEPGTYAGRLINDGTIAHDITFGDGEPILAAPGETVEFEFAVPEGGLTFLCSIPGHTDAGMTGSILTPGSTTAETATDERVASTTAADEIAADPDAPPYELRDPVVPARGEGDGVTLVPGGADDGGDLIEVEMVVEEKLMTVAEGYQQLVWTFNGTVPGPVLRTQVGDTVRVHLVNPPEASASHSVDFHASQVAWNDEMRSIAPGEDLVYEFTTDYAGVWMYHCGTDPVLHHIANGMFGMVIVEPTGGLSPVDHEFFLTQNEWYLGPQGETSSYAKANQAAPAPDFVMFNGIAFQYKDHPIEVPTGDTVRFYVLDVGPSIDSSFHIVGTIFHDVIKEGIHLAAGNDGNWGSQAVDLAPAQGAIVELTTAEDGLYPIVTHAFNFPGRGALGLLQAGDGEP
jgi:nitrite reductase (NO-forming)